jgi:hypothetical protein
MSPRNHLCLFIAPLKGDDSATRGRSEDVYASLVVPAAKQAGFFPDFILDDEPGTILNHIVRSITAANVVVADLTGNNFSVGYELALAHMISKPTIPVIKSGCAKPFDVQTMRAVEYDYSSRGALRAAIPQLVEQLKRVRTAPVMTDNPLQNALKAVEPPKQAPPLSVIPPTLPPPGVPRPIESPPRSAFFAPLDVLEAPPDIGAPPPSAFGVALRTLAGLGVPAEAEPPTPLSVIAGLSHDLGHFDASAPPDSLAEVFRRHLGILPEPEPRPRSLFDPPPPRQTKP